MRRFMTMLIFSFMIAGASLAPAAPASAGWQWCKTCVVQGESGPGMACTEINSAGLSRGVAGFCR